LWCDTSGKSQTIEAKEKERDYQKQSTCTATPKITVPMEVAVGIASHVKHA
jgi:hypothetical protein